MTTMTTLTTITRSRGETDYYQVSVKKGLLGGLKVTVIDQTKNTPLKTGIAKQIEAAAKQAISSQLSRGETIKLQLTARNGQITVDSLFGSTEKHVQIAQIFEATLKETEPSSAVERLQGKRLSVNNPISAVEAIYHNLPNQKITIDQWKSYLCYSVETSSLVEVNEVCKELKEALTHDQEAFNDFQYNPGLFKRKQRVTPELMSRIEGLTKGTEPMTKEGEKLIRQVYAHYIKKSGRCLDEYFLRLVNTFCPKHSIFLRSETTLKCFSQDPEQSNAFHTVFLGKKTGQFGFFTLERDQRLNSKKEFLRCPGETVAYYRPSRNEGSHLDEKRAPRTPITEVQQVLKEAHSTRGEEFMNVMREMFSSQGKDPYSGYVKFLPLLEKKELSFFERRVLREAHSCWKKHMDRPTAPR